MSQRVFILLCFNVARHNIPEGIRSGTNDPDPHSCPMPGGTLTVPGLRVLSKSVCIMRVNEDKRVITIEDHSIEVWYTMAKGKTAGEDTKMVYEAQVFAHEREIFEMGIICGWILRDHKYSLTDRRGDNP